jgi:hypothetical protein
VNRERTPTGIRVTRSIALRTMKGFVMLRGLTWGNLVNEWIDEDQSGET